MQFSSWVLVIDRLIAPWGTVGYLAMALTLPTNDGWDSSWGIRAGFAIPQVICAAVLLLGATGFALARRRRG